MKSKITSADIKPGARFVVEAELLIEYETGSFKVPLYSTSLGGVHYRYMDRDDILALVNGESKP